MAASEPPERIVVNAAALPNVSVPPQVSTPLVKVTAVLICTLGVIVAPALLLTIRLAI